MTWRTFVIIISDGTVTSPTFVTIISDDIIIKPKNFTFFSIFLLSLSAPSNCLGNLIFIFSQGSFPLQNFACALHFYCRLKDVTV